MLGNSADTLQPGAVRGMAQLAASSVKGLKTENVTITDSTGARPVAVATRPAARGGGSSSKAAAEARYARQKESSINAMLASTLGPGKAQVKVNADLNMDETTEKELTVRRQGHAAEDHRGDREAQGRQRPPPAARPAPAPTSRPTRTATATAAANSQLRARKKAHRLRRQQEGHARPRSPPARSTSSTSRCWSTSRSRPTSSPAQDRRSAPPPASTPRAVTRSARRRWPSPRPETPKAGPVPTTLLGPLKWVGLGLAAPAVPLLHDARHAASARART